MRIIQVVRGFGPAGGASGVAYQLHRQFLESGADARVLTGMLNGLAEPDDTVDLIAARTVGLEKVGQPWRRVVLPFSSTAFGLAAGARLRNLASDGDRDRQWVVSHGDYTGGDVLVLHSVHAAALKEAWDSGDRRFLLNPLHPWLLTRNRLTYRFGRHRKIVVVGSRLLAELERWHGVSGDRVVHIPNGVDVERFHPGRRDVRQQVLADLGIYGGSRVILFAGHEFERKGLDLAVRALARMETPAVLLVVGDDDPSRFRALAASLGIGDRVLFAGRREDMPDLYGVADAFLLPSRYESFALVCIEALATGVPVVAPRIGGVEDYVVDSVNGFLVEREEVPIADALDRLLGNPAFHSEMASAARSSALAFDWKEIAGRYLDLLEAL
jgi:UDP-glucose:(heptosyl)LPS alpha-1,3-glucosyltransferase